MLPRAHRLTKPADFRRVIRSGRVSRQSTVIVYGSVVPGGLAGATNHDGGQLPRIGVTVSKAVGGSVVRHSVARVIRHVIGGMVMVLPPDSLWVVRALPKAGVAMNRGQIATDVRAGVEQIVGALVLERA